MDFADETYVRLYTRKTLTWHQLGWEGRVVERAMLGEFDEAGLFAIRGDAAACVSMVTELPIDLVRIGLQRLVETETWMVTPRSITWPTYEEAQNCRRSDRVRQRESRRARSAQSVTDVTTSHTPSQLSPLVTASHPPSLCSLPPSAPLLSSSPKRDPEPESSPVATEIRRITPPDRTKGIFVPDTWEPKDPHRVRCQELRFDLAALVRDFRNHEFNREYSDWDRRFSQWIEKEKTNRETALAKALAAPPARAGPRTGSAPQQPPKGIPVAEVLKNFQ